MVDIEYLPHRPLTEGEFEDFVETQSVECPLAFHAYCGHCDTEGVVDALIRDGRQVYALHHGHEEWELKTLEQDMDPEMFQMMVSQLDPAMLRQIGGDQLPDVEADVESELDFDQIGDDVDFDLPPVEGVEVPDSEAIELPDGPPLRELVDEDTRQELDAQLQQIMDDHVDSLDEQEIERIFEQTDGPTPGELAELLDPAVMQELNQAIAEAIDDEMLQDIAAEQGGMTDDDFPMMLDMESEDRFLDLYAHLLVYVNDRFDVIEGIETVGDISNRNTSDLLPLRQRLYEEDTEAIIESFVEENPANLPADDLDTVADWTDSEYGECVVVRHLSDYAVLLDWSDPPRAFGVKAVRMPFTDLWPEERLPVFLSEVALLPFEDQIVTDGWLAIQRVVAGGNLSTDIDDSYEEAKHRLGIIETLPAPDESEKSDAEQLRFYLKNKRNRERYAEEITELKNESTELEQIYHQEMGKARARSLGRELRETDLKEAYFAIYDDRIVASGTTEQQVREILADILPDGKETHPYIYHYDP
ncbi:hypothetical protein [Halapricum hydrolyticum]|uniref:Uncharacterized protein n=1 Tax=Halapricum hydrolyticum TaxID=2979991 RepID=A0AAE3ICL2_9EURY|nr:hypothetical protein [Halapricum hydrolyticum]MCU4718550.1 hypothetical protein [Halapricum hydrolyticum]MCU4727601.1 hypothetical protein [Halapricum hydrolyticum]